MFINGDPVGWAFYGYMKMLISLQFSGPLTVASGFLVSSLHSDGGVQVATLKYVDPSIVGSRMCSLNLICIFLEKLLA